MKTKLFYAFFCSIIFAIFSVTNFASVFEIYGHGARALAQANAFTARASDPSAIWFNPAGITQLHGTRFYLGISGYYHNNRMSSDFYGGTYTTDNGFLTSPPLYITHQLSKRIWLALGYNTTAYYYQYWGDTPTAANPVPQSISFIKTNTRTISPTFVFKLKKNLSMGIGLHFARSIIKIKKWDADGIDELLAQRTGIQTSRVDISSIIDLSGNNLSFFTGLNWQISPKIRLGITYHHGSGLDGKGRFDFTLPTIGNDTLDADLAVIFPDQDIRGKFQNCVDTLSIGLSICLGDKIELEGDVVLRLWSQLDQWEITDINPLTIAGMKGDYGTTLEVDWNWVDRVSLRFGAEYHASKSLDLRCGVLFDPSPIPSEYLNILAPDSSRFGISAGFGYKFKNLYLDLAYLIFFANEREEASKSQYFFDMILHSTRGNVLSLSFGIKF